MKKFVIWAIVIAAISFLLRMFVKNRVVLMSYKDILFKIFEEFEGFHEKPYWDVKQWTWGYGTRVPGSSDNPAIKPTGTIGKVQAAADAFLHVNKDYNVLKTLVKPEMSQKQWAALLSFSYNLGIGNAKKIVETINNKMVAGKIDGEAVEYHMRQYVYADGKIEKGLQRRRKYESDLFNNKI